METTTAYVLVLIVLIVFIFSIVSFKNLDSNKNAIDNKKKMLYVRLDTTSDYNKAINKAVKIGYILKNETTPFQREKEFSIFKSQNLCIDRNDKSVFLVRIDHKEAMSLKTFLSRSYDRFN